VKCGAVDRYSNGKCKPCHRTSAAKYRQSDKGRAKIREYYQSDEVRANRKLTKLCVKCGEIDRYSSGVCKPCQKKGAAKYRQSDKGRAKEREYRQSDEVSAKKREYRQSDECRAKEREYQRKKSQTAIGRQRRYAANAKYKKTLFEFSLQNQQKVIKQCQQKSTQSNETN
jgi:hypothetical protein